MSTVLVLLASDRVSGPAKGLFQLFQHARGSSWRFLLALFHLPDMAGETECAELADRMGVPRVDLEQRRRYDPTLLWQVRRIARAHGVSVLQSHHYKGHLICFLLRRMVGLPWVAFAHGWTDEDRRVRLYNRLDRWLLRYPDRVVAVSDGVRRRLEQDRVSPGRITVVPNAVEIPPPEETVPDGRWRSAQGLPAGAPIVSVVGRLSPEKGQDVFVDACRILRDEGLDFVAALVGDGPLDVALRDRVRSLGLDRHVRLTGHVRDVTAVYRDTDLVVIPSRAEGLPNALLEALAFGRPVVACAVGGIPEVIRDGDSGRLVPRGDARALADAMAPLLRDQRSRAALARRGLEVAQRFSPRARAERILGLYASLAPAHGSGG